jgi:hypothetical protein
MKLDELKKIIKEELKSILKANAPEEEKKTKEKETEKEKKRRGFDPTPIKREPGKEPLVVPVKNKTPLKEIEKNILDKITARFKNSQK